MAESAPLHDTCDVETHQNTSVAHSSASPNDILSLVPMEIAHEIFSHLGYRDRARCAQVSKGWRDIADDKQGYKEQYNRDFPDPNYRSYGGGFPAKWGWKLVYILEHNRDFPHRLYIAIEPIPYHTKNAEIEMYWRLKTAKDMRWMMCLLRGVIIWHPVGI